MATRRAASRRHSGAAIADRGRRAAARRRRATFLSDVTFDQYPGVVLWLGGAIILHDGVGAMAVFGVTVLAAAYRRLIPFVVLAIVQARPGGRRHRDGAGGPRDRQEGDRTANPSILPLDYLRNLVLF